MEAVAKATGFEISSSILSNFPQNLEKGSSVSGIAPKLIYDPPASVPDEDDDECRGESACSVIDVLGAGRKLSGLGGGARMANGGRPLAGDTRVAGYVSSICQ
jgi:hypothetical protein